MTLVSCVCLACTGLEQDHSQVVLNSERTRKESQQCDKAKMRVDNKMSKLDNKTHQISGSKTIRGKPKADEPQV